MEIVGIVIFVLCFIFLADIGIIIDLLFSTIIEKIFPDKEESETISFRGSLVHYGLRGGALYIDGENVTYRNQSSTIPDEFKHLVIPLNKITKVEKSTAMFLPAVILHISKYKSYKFVVFNRSRFLELVDPSFVKTTEKDNSNI